MTQSEQIDMPRYLDAPEPVWVKCEEVREFWPVEVGCLIDEADGESRFVIVQSHHCDLEKKLVRGVKVAAWPQDSSDWLIDIQSGTSFERLLISDEKVSNGHSV